MKLHHEFLHADTGVESFEADEAEAINRMQVFSWESELMEAEWRKECSPTVSLEYPEKKRVLWASAVEKDKGPEFLVCFQDKSAPKAYAVSENDGVTLKRLARLFQLFYRGEFDALRSAINESVKSQGANTTRRILTIRWLAFEIAPLAAALGYSYYHPRELLLALCFYSILALVSVGMSIKDGVVQEKYGFVCEREKDKFGFWFWIFCHALFPLLVLSVAILFPRTLVFPPK